MSSSTIPTIPADAASGPAAADSQQASSAGTPQAVLHSNQPLPTIGVQNTRSKFRRILDAQDAQRRAYLHSKVDNDGVISAQQGQARRVSILTGFDATTTNLADVTRTPSNSLNVFNNQRVHDVIATSQESASTSVTRSTPVYATTPYMTNKYSDPVAFAMKKRVTTKNLATGQVESLTETKPVRLAQPYRGYKSVELRNTWRFTDNVKGPPQAVLDRLASERPEDLLLRVNNGAGVPAKLTNQVLSRQKFVQDANSALAMHAKTGINQRFVSRVLW